MGPVVEEVAEAIADEVIFYDVNTDHSPDLASQFGIMSIPTMVLFKNGEEVTRSTGARPKDAVIAFAKSE
ncbi:thioredoxin family protein [Camelliibacillus cellulosilyticus]|uniref:Thioredoxin family protein n=1 Tax=Camelliibacillus cellulosilyticus TaxID=2174486 RepID=A0ABV9GR37_9BACL